MSTADITEGHAIYLDADGAKAWHDGSERGERYRRLVRRAAIERAKRIGRTVEVLDVDGVVLDAVAYYVGHES